jgi:hypothetical protein
VSRQRVLAEKSTVPQGEATQTVDLEKILIKVPLFQDHARFVPLIRVLASLILNKYAISSPKRRKGPCMSIEGLRRSSEPSPEGLLLSGPSLSPNRANGFILVFDSVAHECKGVTQRSAEQDLCGGYVTVMVRCILS